MSKIPLLSEEGWREAPGWFQNDNLEGWWLWNHPSRDALRDPAALLTEEGNRSFLILDQILGMLSSIMLRSVRATVISMRVRS